MMWRDTVDLVSISYTINDVGNNVEVEKKSTVFANKKSIRQSEFYQAMANGLKPELMFEIRSIDYSNQDRLEYDSKEYDIIRAFDKNGEITELICQGIVGTEVR